MNEKMLQIEVLNNENNEIEKINIKSTKELFNYYNEWSLSGGKWPIKLINLANLIDQKCKNVGKFKGKGINALCIIVRLFAFCLAIDKQFRNNNKLIKYYRNIDILYIEWIKEGINSILKYYLNKNKIKKILNNLIEEYNKLFTIINKNNNLYIKPIPGIKNKNNLLKDEQNEKLNFNNKFVKEFFTNDKRKEIKDNDDNEKKINLSEEDWINKLLDKEIKLNFSNEEDK
ncbi:hypothetical protein Mgra_00004636 [Meloidogyne graminicola]|uniref:Uncharacterized protein n=1 Tax=Meloidogyne graminicola TaxID=189291 RepID=A0A8S9ZRM9_9BILA|nr:hypothetical protein Mgra_00004636 [Meloidogyne graminicola]